MNLTIEELKEKLILLDEITLMETLEINSEMLVEEFEDKIIQKYDILAQDIENDTSTWD